MVGLSIGASRATTIYGLSYMLVGYQPCLDFLICQQDINHVWTFLCASRTSNMAGLSLGVSWTTTIFGPF